MKKDPANIGGQEALVGDVSANTERRGQKEALDALVSTSTSGVGQ
jgi:hypothetical protein